MQKLPYTAFVAIASCGLASAATTLTPSDIHGGVTTNTSFANGDVTLTPSIGGAPATFGGNANFLGIPGGSNNNAFDDSDTDATNDNGEELTMAFAPTVGLTQIAYNFARADGGASDGVFISGFNSDPGVTFSVSDASLFAVWDGVDTVRLNLPGALFSTATVISFDPAASAGETLLLTISDTTQAGAQLPIGSITYDTIPEPSSTALLALGGLALLRRRR
ncbi:PEP-CTERM sorting domain-containing protein [Roseibacillus persicicus]|uniref:PEP-CTERM sorting domain-containing protein n=1 Tax=Roseibacillus persicicus TaxID=454148 RepID=UPI00398A6323